MDAKAIMEKLQAPFKEDEIEWKVQRCGISNNKPWVMVCAYIQARAIQNRLDEIFGCFGWADEYRNTNNDVICRLGVNTPEGWIYKENGASNTGYEAFKGGISGAFKRVASSGYGIGRYLYNLDEQYAECSLSKENGCVNKATTKDKKNDIYWKTPKLPKWALPPPEPAKITKVQRVKLFGIGTESIIKKVIELYGYKSTEDIKQVDYEDIYAAIEGEQKAQAQPAS